MMHFGRFSFNEDVIDYIELQGDGSYLVYLPSTRDTIRPPYVHIGGEDADALRDWLERDRENEATVIEHNREILKSAKRENRV